MSVILYQDKLLAEIDRFSSENFPTTILIVGEEGSGKHLLCNYIADKCSLSVCDITANICRETFDAIEETAVGLLYIIDLSHTTIREQNIILKFIEEPPRSAHIVLMTSRIGAVIGTVQARCHKFTLDHYSKEQLSDYAHQQGIINESVVEISRTPGDVIYFNNFSEQLPAIKDLCVKLFTNIHKACFSNTLKVSSSIAYREDASKYNAKCFFRTLKSTALEFVKERRDTSFLLAYDLTAKLCNDIEIPNINVQYLFENYLFSLKEVF